MIVYLCFRPLYTVNYPEPFTAVLKEEEKINPPLNLPLVSFSLDILTPFFNITHSAKLIFSLITNKIT